jgi:Zn-finger nucleic acid-binding protein
MAEHVRGGVTVMQCVTCQGVFLPHADLGLLVEQENEWHVASGPTTQPIPRILPGMTAPPDYPPARQARSYIDELFG